VPTIYFGGGTPSLLTPAEISSLLEEVRHHFQLDTAVEITLEANPGTVTPESLQGYLSAGITRLSLGVQSLDDRQLALLGRIHTAETARGAYAAARTAGFDNVGIDLIHGLPGQTIEDWVKTLQAAVGMKPEHISAYGLSVEEGTPLAVLADRGELDLPDEDTAAAMFEITSEFLRKSGYEHYEISNFALPGYRSRHNQVYWQRGNYLGFGAGAHSFLNTPGHGGRWENPAALPEYAAIVNSAELPELQSSMTHGEAMSEFMFLGLRLLEGVDRGDFARQYGKELEEAFPKIVSLLGEKGLLCLEGTNVRLTSRGLLLANQVMQEFV
jgi:oxygen-independent coproporphyrinogen-3 oxidase